MGSLSKIMTFYNSALLTCFSGLQKFGDIKLHLEKNIMCWSVYVFVISCLNLYNGNKDKKTQP